MGRRSSTKTGRRAPSSRLTRTPASSTLSKSHGIGADPYIFLALAVATFAVYLPLAGHQFILLDDNEYITGNPMVVRGLSWSAIRWAFTTFHAANWHPLTWLSHMFDCHFFGLQAGSHLLVNLLFHIANTLLVFVVFRRATGRTWPSAFVAALFALHPLHVESVAWASERKDTLSAFFSLLSLFAYLRYTEARSARRFASVVLTLACGLMAKPMVVTWPFVLLLLDYWPLQRLSLRTKRTFSEAWPLLREKLLLMPLVLGSIVMTTLAQQTGGAFHALAQAPFSLRLANALVSYVSYLRATFWPTGLAVYYPFPIHGLPAWQPIAASVLLLGITVAALLLSRTMPYLITGWLWFVGTLVPVIGLVQVGGQATADRYTYLPSIGLFFAISFAFADLAARWKVNRIALGAAAAIVLLGCSAVTARQLGYWRDGETLFRRTIAVTPENPPIEYNLGCVLAQNGRYEEALSHFDVLLRADPDSPDAVLSKGAALSELGRLRQANEYLERAAKLNPESVQAHTQYAFLLAKQGRNEDALPEFRRARDLAPQDASARTNLGIILTRLNRMTDAEKELNEAIRLDPQNAEAQSGLGLALLASGHPRESVPHLLAALQLKPDLSAARQNLEHAQAMLDSSDDR